MCIRNCLSSSAWETAVKEKNKFPVEIIGPLWYDMLNTVHVTQIKETFDLVNSKCVDFIAFFLTRLYFPSERRRIKKIIFFIGTGYWWVKSKQKKKEKEVEKGEKWQKFLYAFFSP